VTTPRTRQLARLLAVAVGLSLSLLSAPSLAGAHVLLAPHGHEVSVRADADHVDLVLSHAPSPVSDGLHAAEDHMHSAEGGHVVHLASGDAVRDSLRRGSDPLAAALGFASFAPRTPVLAEALFLPNGPLARAPAPPVLVLRN
jgi:hypothetical protein